LNLGVDEGKNSDPALNNIASVLLSVALAYRPEILLQSRYATIRPFVGRGCRGFAKA